MIADKQALKILFDTYWSSAGWHRDRDRMTSPHDFEYAKQHGVMFDPIVMSHDQVVNELISSVKLITKQQVANAFLASLSTRRLDWRSALGSYAVFQQLRHHDEEIDQRQCVVCGIFTQFEMEDVNVLNFERWKWGGVRHDQPFYAFRDLQLFMKEAAPTPTAEDLRIFENLLLAINAAPTNTTAAALQSHFSNVLKSNKGERDRIIAILGFCGILATAEHPGYSDRFVLNRERRLPNHHFLDMSYPACWWRREAGVNQTRVDEYFGHALKKA